MSTALIVFGRHAVKIWREPRWPHQWIGTCSCGCGIRTNSRDAAERFLEDSGCLEPR